MVVIILGIFASIAIPIFYKQRERVWDAAVKSDLRNAATAQETFLTEANPGPFATTVAELVGCGIPTLVRLQLLRRILRHGGSRGLLRQLLPHRAIATGTYFARSSDLGQITSASPLDPVTCQ